MPSIKESIHEMKQQCYKSFEKQDSSHHEAPVVFVSESEKRYISTRTFLKCLPSSVTKKRTL